MIYIVIPVLNRWTFTKECLNSLERQTIKDFKVVIVDHGSTDGTSKNIAKDYPWVTLLSGDESMWWTAATNVGIKWVLSICQDQDLVLTLNNDLIVRPKYLEQLLQIHSKNDSALVGSLSVDIQEPNSIDFCGVKWNRFTAKFSGIDNIYRNSDKDLFLLSAKRKFFVSDMLPGRGVLIPVTVLKKIGLYNETHFPHYGADLDFSIRAKKAGHRLLVSTQAIVYSHVNLTGSNNQKHPPFFLRRILKIFSSRKSPNNIRVRYFLAVKHSPIKIFHFVFDVVRITISSLRNN